MTKCQNQDVTEIVSEFALPIQSYALTHLLDMPEQEAETWISWGTEIYLEGGDEAKEKGQLIEDYITKMFEMALNNHGNDIFSALNNAEFQGRQLTHERN